MFTNVLLPTGVPQQTAITRLTFQSFVFLYFLTGLAAYKVGGVPVPWIAQSGFIALAIGVIGFTNKVRPLPGFGLLAIFLLWAFFVTVMNLTEDSGIMPTLATQPYWAYITFRYINFISFISALYLTYWLVSEGKGEELLRWIVIVAAVICAFSLYIFLAHILNLPELSRNRAGTAGDLQAIRFDGDGASYNRAVGTFREPGHLAEWLILPFFLSFAFRERRDRIRSYIITGTIIVTFSMMALFSIVAGTLIGFLFTKPFSKRTLKIVGAAVVLGALAFFLLSAITVGTVGETNITLGTIVQNRVGTILFGGLGASNRSYVYDFMADHPFPALGMGIGNGNLEFARVIGVDTVAAFLSLYIFTLYSAGYPGMLILGIFLLRPVAKYVRNFKRTIPSVPLVFMTYSAYLVASAVASEEVTPWLGIIAGLMVCEAQHLEYVRKKFAASRVHARSFARRVATVSAMGPVS